MKYIVTKDSSYFEKIGEYNYCLLSDMILPDVIAIDSETTGLVARHENIFCIQIGTGENCYIIKMYDNDYTFNDLIPYLEGKTMIFHNALFDLGFFYKYDFFPENIRDTYLASRILNNNNIENKKNDFGAVMEREIGVKYDKTEQKNIATVKLSQPTTIEYSFNDVDRLIDLHDALEKKLIDRGQEETYMLHCRYIRALAYMEQCGMPVSSQCWKEKMIVDLENTAKSKRIIEDYIFDNIPIFKDNQLDLFDTIKRVTVSVASPMQMLKVFEYLKINTKDKDGKDSINENIISKSKHEFVPMWLEFQEANHRVSTFGEKIYSQIENERVYTNFNPMVDTARLSTRRGNINFLNFPSDKITRNCFIANAGNVMIVCDYSGQETVIAADFSQDEAMMDSVINGSDLHCAFARILFPKLKELSDEEIIKNHKSKRQAAKAPRFAFQYGGNAFTIHMNEGIPLEDAQKIEIAFKNLHSGLYTWGEEVYKKSVITGYITSVDGWKLKLPDFEKFNLLDKKVKDITKAQWSHYREGKSQAQELKKDKNFVVYNRHCLGFFNERKNTVSGFFKLKSEYQRLCLNNPVQSCGAHMLKRATALFFEWILANNYIWKVRIASTVHDEIILECEESLKDIVKEALEECMIEGGNYYLNNLTIKADAKYGNSWYEAK
jgi:DNA polymerase I-like protein with 3'-5' exonuclease and polymerase domains